MNTARLRWVPNFFTILRLLLVVPIVLAAVHGAWMLGFWLVIVALLTDFADGLAAKRLQAYTRLGEVLDPIADFSLAAAGVVSIIVTGHMSWWVGFVMLLPAVYVGYIKFIAPKDAKVRILQPVFSVPYLFVVWALTAWFFAAQAFGWSWWYLVVSGMALALAASLKRHRLRAWFGGVTTRLRH
jgi:phosphatidylglycerophosphate synthase